MSSRRLRILYLCTGNSCRSQMAEAWTRELHADRVEALSAGTDPHGMDARMVTVMEEAGLDLSSHRSKGLGDVDLEDLDLVVTVCGHAHENCPVFPGDTPILHRGFEDPPALARTARDEQEALEHYRRVRDEIRDFVRELPDTILAAG